MMSTFNAERDRDEIILGAGVLLNVLFVVFGWSKLTRYSAKGRLHGSDWSSHAADRRGRDHRRRGFRGPCRRPWRLDPPARAAAGALNRWNRPRRAPFLDDEGAACYGN